MLQRDYLMRMIHQAIAALTRARSLKDEQKYDLAVQSVDAALVALVHMDRRRFAELDLATLITLLGPAPVVRTAARACALEAEIRECQGDSSQALASFQRALELYAQVGPGDELEDQQVAAGLIARFRKSGS